MSGHSPSRLRSDFADFFRPSSGHVRQTQNDPQTPILQPPLLDVPQSSESPTRLKKMSKIPFLGRPRKKSTQSSKSGVPVASSSSAASRGYDSSEIPDSEAIKTARLSHPVPPSAPEPTLRQPPVPTIAPPSNSSSSIGLKFAAHFAHPKSRKSPLPRISRAAYSEGEASDTLLPPVSPRGASFDSKSSGASRSSTPRPERPTITVSPSPDNIDDYKDLFTLPRMKKQRSITPASEYRDKYHESASNVTLNPANVSSRIDSLSDYSSAGTDAALQTSQSLAEGRRSSQSSRSSIQPSASIKRSESMSAGVHVQESAGSVRSAQVAPVIDIRPPSPLTGKPSSPVPRSARQKTPVSNRPSQPPSIPLPPPPNASPPASPVPAAASVFSTRTPSGISGFRRPRAHTVSTIPPTPRTSPPSPPTSPSGVPKRAKSPIDKGTSIRQSSDKENINLDTATVEELKQALASRKQQYEDLASHLLKVAATHAAEKNALEKKISTLEKDAARKDKEIKGLTWLLVNNRISLGGPEVEAALNSAQLAYRPSADSMTRVSSRPFRGAEDSGAESHQTSGAESISGSVRGSGTSGTESHTSLHVKKARRPTLAETTYNLYRSSTKASRGLGIEPISTDLTRRSSVYSLSSSATSSTSSLLPPNPSGGGSPLSAIPEGPNQIPPVPSTRIMRERGSLSAGEGEKDDRRTTSSRSSHRISTSSLTSSSSGTSAATSAYSANLKRGRPPSIAQVLEKSSAVEDVFQKLRPFKLTAGAP